MKDLVEYIVKNIANFPDDVSVTDEVEGEYTTIRVNVNPQDLPRVIGKEGKIIRAIKNIVKTAARKKNLWVNVVLED